MMLDLLIYGSLWNLLVFALYSIDKWRAIRGDWRISEKTLLLVTFFGGGLGALLGGNWFHHKTRKWYFQLSWYVGTTILLGLCYWLWLHHS